MLTIRCGGIDVTEGHNPANGYPEPGSVLPALQIRHQERRESQGAIAPRSIARWPGDSILRCMVRVGRRNALKGLGAFAAAALLEGCTRRARPVANATAPELLHLPRV